MVGSTLNSVVSARIRRPEMVSNWWDDINESTQWQHGIFITLYATYALLSTVALIQFIKIHYRVPQSGWTTQKVFHFMNFFICGVRAAIFRFHLYVFALKPKVLMLILLEFPGLLFFTTYSLLVHFWADIYYRARSLSTATLRSWYISVNCIIYVIQVLIWVYLWMHESGVVEYIAQMFFAVVSLIAALGFLLYGGRLFYMLLHFPIESRERKKKLHEVGSVGTICFTCFLIRCFMVVLSALDDNASLEVLVHPVLNFIYYMYVKILPSVLVLFILRKLPSRRGSRQYSTGEYHLIQ
ncbi:tobamovirus multiplication protein 1-like isoform X1 [Amaranthus tricolor]|uniref:tobamovirus multiplication protein 1-like isoform X1 n=1 Tax=Amaranthus tricolor TaxID=29722 RepID=UPI0025830247|nr:tobamovirus multiplication protein 1-like isoform X1 [Amaranthus tricolor]XP_057540420.1 tobamovirus multiplication protein 1-like isoform X1 [Amaranthus tricolor]